MIKEITVDTSSRTELIDITSDIERLVKNSGVVNGICHIYTLHTTCGLIINENADASVKADILNELNKVIPFRDNYSHSEGNSAAHIKASLIGPVLTVFVEKSELLLGQWQGIFFCEFDGHRRRKVLVKIIADR